MTIMPANTGMITEIKKFATHDGPGIRTTVFLKGCPLHCAWCSNPETIETFSQLYFRPKRCKGFGACVDICPEKAVGMDIDAKVDRKKCTLCMKCAAECPNSAFMQIGEIYSLSDLMREIEKDKPFYGKEGGVTLSGGEPLFQAGFTLQIFKRSKEIGISTVLDTSGCAASEVVREIMEYTDLILLDIKHMDPQMHRQGTGVDNVLILKNARIMASMRKMRVSLPLIPDYNDSEENLSATAEFALSLGVDHIDINPLHKLGADKYTCLGLASPYDAYRPLDKQDVMKARDIIKAHGLKVTVGRMM
ncbi:MAG: glycyl-radical enzyme activating protein [Desulfomonilia bacterium]|jgi:pyruvate formate lyase activating enzyme|nr:glycyl-radical enzyme activating protein [Desulfomonilia bacterium]